MARTGASGVHAPTDLFRRSQQRFITTPEIVETVVPVTAAVTWSGQSVTPTLVVTVSAAATAWSGPETVTANQTVPVTAAAVTWTGQTITVTVATVVPVTTGSVTWTGQTVTANPHGSRYCRLRPVARPNGQHRYSHGESRLQQGRYVVRQTGHRTNHGPGYRRLAHLQRPDRSTLGPGHRWIGGVDRANGHRIGTQYHVRSCYRWCCGL